MSHILEVRDLQVQYHAEDGAIYALNHASLELDDGGTLDLVGETGAGKTTLAKGTMHLVPDPPGRIEGGVIELEDKGLLEASGAGIRVARGNQVSMILQDPISSLSPVTRVGEQVTEVVRVHERYIKKEAGGKATEVLETVDIPIEGAEDFPHRFSDGMKRRVVIAITLAYNPKVLITDGSITTLGVTIQAQVPGIMRRLKDKYHAAVLLITHDLGMVARMCEKMVIMYAGEVVEGGVVLDIYKHTLHPHIEGLLRTIPQIHLYIHGLNLVDGLMPDPMTQRVGCPFADWCKHAFERCRVERPWFINAGSGYRAYCLKIENELREEAGERWSTRDC